MPRLSPKACRSADAQREGTVLDGMVFIDLQVAANRRESVRSRHAWQFVPACDRRNRGRWRCCWAPRATGRDRWRCRFLWSCACTWARRACAEDAPRNGGPRLCFGRRAISIRRPVTPKIRGKFQVGDAIADHEARRLVDGLSIQVLAHHADTGLATAAVLMFEVRHRYIPRRTRCPAMRVVRRMNSCATARISR